MAVSERSIVIAATDPQTHVLLVSPQIRILREAGWIIHLVASPGNWRALANEPTVHIHEIPMSRAISPISDAKAERDWLRFLKTLQPLAVVGSTPKAGLLSMVAAKINRVPLRIFLHRGARWETATGPARRALRAADRLTLLCATNVLAVSPSLADLIVAEGLTSRRPTVLGNGGSKGVDLDRFRPVDRAQRSDLSPTIGYLGRLNRDKGLETVLHVYDKLKVRWPRLRLLVGGRLDDHYQPSPDVISRLRGGAGIQWEEWVDSSRFLPRLDVLVFPSAREGLPNAVIEAAACGVPTVAWDVTGVRDAIAPGISGTLVPYGLRDEFTSAVRAILEAPPNSYQSGCLEWARSFDQEKLSREFITLIGDWATMVEAGRP